MNDESTRIRRLAVIKARTIRGHKDKIIERGLKKRALSDPAIPVRIAAVPELAGRRSAALFEDRLALNQTEKEELSAEVRNYFLLFDKKEIQDDKSS